MGFQNIIKLLKPDKQNLNYRRLKVKPLRYIIRYIISEGGKPNHFKAFLNIIIHKCNVKRHQSQTLLPILNLSTDNAPPHQPSTLSQSVKMPPVACAPHSIRWPARLENNI